MADRIVQVTIRANVSNFLAETAKVRQATEQTATAAQKLEKQGAAFEKVGAGITTIGVAASAAVAIAVKSFADFDAQMSQVQSLSHATASEMDKLRNAALTMGQGIGFSATEVADAETELVKAGISVTDILGGGLKGALSLAAAGQIEVGRATEIAASAMTQFGLKGKDVPHIADLLAAGADKALGGVEQLGQALQQSGLVANQFGLSIDETVGTLAEFAQNGLMGSDAGTSLKQMFLQLATPTKQASEAMKQYHISAYDAQGDFVGITSLAGQLAAGFKGVDDASRNSALGIIFGSDAIRAANILMNDGADKNREWIKSVNAAGFAAAQAAGKTDNLQGDVKKLGAALESGLIKSGSASNDVLRLLTQNATGFVQAIGNAPQPVLGLGLGLTALVGATALAGGGFLQLVPKISAAKAAMKDLQISGKTLAKGFGGGTLITLGLAAVASGIANVGAEAELTEGQLRKLNAAMTSNNTKSLNAQFVGGSDLALTGFNAITSKVTTARQALQALNDDAANIGFAKFADGATFGLTHLSDTAKQFEAQFKQMGTTLATTAESDFGSATNGFNALVKQMGGGQQTARDLLDRMEPYKDELTALASAAGHTASQQDLLNLAQGKGKLAAELAANSTEAQNKQLADLSGVASQANDDISKLADQIRNFGSTQFNAEQTESDFRAAIDDATSALKENGVQLDKHTGQIDLNSEKGRANADALRKVAQDGIAAAGALYENGASVDEVSSKMAEARKATIDAAKGFGLSGDAAEQAADRYKLIPGNVKTVLENEGFQQGKEAADSVTGAVKAVPSKKVTELRGEIKDAKAKVAELQAKLRDVPKSKSTQLNAEVAAARANLSALQTQLNNINSKSITITTNRVNVGDGSPGRGAGVMLKPNLHGAVLNFYANGGMRENHVAQIAPAGAMRLWAEPETGGEAYIPLAPGKRQRSLAIWQETGRRLDAYANGGLVATRTTQDKAAKARYAAAKAAQRRASSAYSKAQTAARNAKGAAKRAADAQLASARAALARAQQETRDSQTVAKRAAAALTAAKNAPMGPDLGDRLSFRSAVRDGSYDTSNAVRDLYSMGQDSGKYSGTQRSRFLDVANRSEIAMLKLQKQSDAAAKSVETASDKLGDLKSASASMASAVQGKLSDFSYGNYRSGTSLLRGLTSRAGKLKQFQALLVTLQKNGLAPALLNEIASLGVDEGLPLAKSLAAMSKKQLSAINSQYGSITKTSTAIGNQVANANYKPLIDAAQKQLTAANKNADKIAKAIADQSKSLQKLIGKALGLPGYSVGGYTGSGGLGQVAGLVHGQEFVVNAAATARNRSLLEQLNAGQMRYMTPNPVFVQQQPADQRQFVQNVDVKPMQHVDANTMMTVLGRETSRAFAGMVE